MWFAKLFIQSWMGRLSSKDTGFWETTHGESGHSTNPARAQKVFRQWSQAHGVTHGVPCAQPGVGLDDTDRSFPTWIFYDSRRVSTDPLALLGAGDLQYLWDR